MSFIFQSWKASGFDDDSLPDIVASCEAKSPTCGPWVQCLANFVVSCSRSGDWLQDLQLPLKAAKGHDHGSNFLGEDFIAKLTKVRGPPNVDAFGNARWMKRNRSMRLASSFVLAGFFSIVIPITRTSVARSAVRIFHSSRL